MDSHVTLIDSWERKLAVEQVLIPDRNLVKASGLLGVKADDVFFKDWRLDRAVDRQSMFLPRRLLHCFVY